MFISSASSPVFTPSYLLWVQHTGNGTSAIRNTIHNIEWLYSAWSGSLDNFAHMVQRGTGPSVIAPPCLWCRTSGTSSSPLLFFLFVLLTEDKDQAAVPEWNNAPRVVFSNLEAAWATVSHHAYLLVRVFSWLRAFFSSCSFFSASAHSCRRYEHTVYRQPARRPYYSRGRQTNGVASPRC